MSGKLLIQILRQTAQDWSDDNAPRLGAALAYYAVFSIAPFLIIAIGVAGLAFGAKAGRGEIVGEIGNAVGQPVAQAIEDTLKQTGSENRSTVATIIGLVLLFFGASGVFIQIQDALNTIWKVTPKPGRAIVAIVRQRFLPPPSFALVVATGLLLLVSLVVSVGLSALGNSLHAAALPGGPYLWKGLHWLISFVLITFLFALTFKIIPDVQIAWRNVWLGAVVTGVLFEIGKYLIGVYLSLASPTSAFGAAGSLAVILLWFYYSSQIFLFGAEFTRVFAIKTDSIVRPTENATGMSPELRQRQGLRQIRQGTSVHEPLPN